ncbi:ImmA/IrrE family metallo-endopeptidase [Leifsonia sp. ZF2019]|uniref:ImmA/IrrE family metallo-endopeptidase n=1 Tax=Leifsonia sp. ZF2019 TaxID=2781978 RepID=UPI001CC18EC0|nr:ImmA/IrrE family metallo-endopeptidase [Leifsonia sp. ZF2019]UAJ78363.1 ImmA/IrrE family metallo-endopeptidase [Leifsonia sp. ZF2019]
MTIDAFDWQQYDQRRPIPGSTSYMYGVDSYLDGVCAMDYDPWVHAEDLGVPVIFRPDLPTPKMVACYSRRKQAIFVRPNQHFIVERCAIAHEIVHFENDDVGTTRTQEDRANRIAARRLIRASRIAELYGITDDPDRIALHLEVTERMLRVYFENHRDRL